MTDPEFELARLLREGSTPDLRALFLRLETAIEAHDSQSADAIVVEIAAQLEGLRPSQP